MTYTSASNIGLEYGIWKGSLDFYEKELDILESRLAQVAEKNTGSEARAGVERFQNQFIIQRNNIDELKHSVTEHAHLVFEDVKHHAGRIESLHIAEHQKIEDSVTTLAKIINDIRHEFNTFLSKWL